MIEEIYQMYKRQKNILKNPEFATTEGAITYCKDVKVDVSILEAAHPEYKERLDREERIQASFTAEQKDFICWQIGEWYVEWKRRIIVDLEEGTHRLGYAKEQLKELICGE